MADQSIRNTSRNEGRVYPPGYGTVEPVANYRPWDVSEEFQRVYQLVKDHTMVDVYRLWTLWQLGPQLPPGAILEVGTWRGGSGVILATAGGPGRSVYLADTFQGVVKAGVRDTYYKGGEHANTSVEIVRSLVERAGLTDVTLLSGVFPDETASAVENERFALCHIDVDVYQSARDVLEWVWTRMVPGGAVVFDDYGFYGCEGVTALVEEIAEGAELPDDPFLVIPSLSGQAILVRTGA